MVSAASMAILDKSEDFSMNTLLLADNQTPSNVDTHSVTAGHIKEQLSSVDDPLPKMRKPYTITKQRERWTEEEHKKFLEALKLYGRAWRQIEEHVGSKTAVQIRSHAQKFFSKVVRESSGSNASSVEPIEIPPPRPKRKPMHPYPRKLVDPLKKGVSVPELPVSSPFPNLSNSEQENQSPTSVLSVVGSDTIGSAGSNSSTGSMSPVSSAAVADPDRFFLSEAHNSPVEQNGSPSPAPEAATAVQDDQVPEIFEDAVAKEGFTVEESTRCLKLFGRTLLVTDPDRPSSPVIGSLEPSPSDMTEGKHLQESSLNADCMWNHSPNGMPGAVYYMRFQNENSNPKEAAFVPPLPWMTYYGGIPFPLVPFPTSDSMKSYPDSIVGADQVKEFQKEGSRTGSNNDLVSEEGNEKNDLGAIERHRMNKPEMKGFVPYKRCLAERDAQSSTFSGGEKEERRTRLCL